MEMVPEGRVALPRIIVFEASRSTVSGYPPRQDWCERRELHPHGLAPDSSSGCRVSWFRHVRKKAFPPDEVNGRQSWLARVAAVPSLITPESGAGRLGSARGRLSARGLNGKVEPARGLAPHYRSYRDRTSLSMFCRLGPGGRTRTSVAPRGNAFTARRNCCSATPG